MKFKLYILYSLYLFILVIAFCYFAGKIVERKFNSSSKATLHSFRDKDFTASEDSLFQRAENEKLLFKLKSNAKKLWDGVEYKINSDSLRDYEYSIEKPLGTKRIVFVGDSFTFGYGVPLEHTFVKQVESILNERNNLPTKWQTINLGMSGFSSDQEVELLRTKGLKYEPDIVVVVYFLNDPDCALKTPLGTTQETLRIVQKYFTFRPQLSKEEVSSVEHYLRSQGILRRLTYLNSFKRYDLTVFHYLHLIPQFWQCVTDSYDLLAQLQQKHKFKLLVAILPVVGLPWNDYPYEDLHKYVGGTFANMPFPVIDLYEVLQEYPGESLRLPNDGHTNSVANEIISRALINTMDRLKFFNKVE